MSSTSVAGVCGSLRADSHSRKALRVALDGAAGAGATTELVDPRQYELPMYDPDIEDQADGPELRAALQDADAVILGTPMYHGSYSNVLKNVLDYSGFDEFENTTVGLLAVSGGSFPITALDHLRSVCRALDAWVLPHEAAVPRASAAFEDGSLTDETLEERLRVLGVRVVQYADIEPEPANFSAEQNAGADH
ncbi:MAG: NADPH-dependent FMN reductase [Halobacteriaceae archaeon]